MLKERLRFVPTTFSSVLKIGFLTSCCLLFFPITAKTVTFSVNSTTDASDSNHGDGNCDDGSGSCTLRAAIEEANALAGADIINVPVGTYTLTTSTQLTVSSDMTISGASQSTTIIQAATTVGTATWRVFEITANGTDATIEDMTIRHGQISNTGSGGGVCINLGIGSSGTANFTRVTITLNKTTGTAIHGGGLSIGDDITTVTMSNCTISNNTSGAGAGGVSQGGAANFTLTDCIITGNAAGTFAGGGFINESGSINTYTRCTISGNSAGGAAGGNDGAGLFLTDQTHTFTNCAIVNNTNAANGGGVYDGTNTNVVTFINCTVANNSAFSNGGGDTVHQFEWAVKYD